LQIRSFIGGLRSVCVNSLLKPNSNANCEDDESKELITLDKLMFCTSNLSESVSTALESECEPTVSQDSVTATIDEVVESWNHHTEQQNLCEVEEDVLLYVGGATLRASASCTKCSSLIRRPYGEKVGVFLMLKEYEFVKEGLLSMTEAASEVISKMEFCFRTNIDHLHTRENILSSLLNKVEDLKFPACPSHIDSLNIHHKSLFMRLRLHAWAKLYIRSFNAEKEAKIAEKKLKKLTA